MFGQMRSSRRRRSGDTRPSSPMSRSEKIVFTIVFCLLLTLFGILFSDFVALPTQYVNRAVIDKKYSPHSQGQTPTGASYGISEKWQLLFDIHGYPSEIKVTHEFYDQVRVGDIFKVTYTRSRIFHEIKITLLNR